MSKLKETRELLQEAIDCMDLKEAEKKRFMPIWNRHKEMVAKMVAEFVDQEFHNGKDQNIEMGYMD